MGRGESSKYGATLLNPRSDYICGRYSPDNSLSARDPAIPTDDRYATEAIGIYYEYILLAGASAIVKCRPYSCRMRRYVGIPHRSPDCYWSAE